MYIEIILQYDYALNLASGTKKDSNNIALPPCHDIINVSF